MPIQIARKKTRRIYVGDIPIGHNAPIAVQSMTNTDTRDISSTIDQIIQLSGAGCEIIRLAVPDMAAADAFGEIKKKTDTPLIADIHFDHRLALAALDAGADGLRINPGNIDGQKAVKAVAKAAAVSNVPIRIGVNSGSLHSEVLKKHGGPTPNAMALNVIHVRRE